MIKQEAHVVRGMQRDLAVSKFSPEYVYDARNIRITARDNNTLLSVSNEKGNKEMYLRDTKGNSTYLRGTVIGYNVLNDYVTVFTTEIGRDRIYRLLRKDSFFECVSLFVGKLGFDTRYPIESLGVYESEDIQKVYWIDGKNQPRVVNITAPYSVVSRWDNNSFDFVQRLRLTESVSVTRDTNTSGMFASGVIQYALTYYNRYGQESNIFYTSPLQYISFDGRGASPEEKVSNSFTIWVDNPDPRFDFMRIYSIHRTSIDAVPTVVNVADMAVTEGESIVYTDNGVTGSTVDPSELLYIGGESITPYTMTQKDNTLFLGNIRLNNKVVDKGIVTDLRNTADSRVSFRHRNTDGPVINLNGYYPYSSTLKYGAAKGFKYLDWYRFGLQFQNTTGRWSEAVYLCDKYNDVHPKTQTELSEAVYNMSQDMVSRAVSQGFVKVRGVVVYPSYSDREVIAQGILCPTVYNVEDRYKNAPFAQSSWFTRPGLQVDGSTYSGDLVDKLTWYNYASSESDVVNNGAWVEFRHNYPIPDNWKRNAEIQCLANVPSTPLVDDKSDSTIASWVASHKEYFFVDQSTLTFHSPDIEFDDSLKNMDMSNIKMRIVGAVSYTADASDLDIQTSTPQNDPDTPGFYSETVGSTNVSRFGVKGLVSGMNYIDSVYGYNDSTVFTKLFPLDVIGFMVYPWHRNGSVNNQPSLTEDETSRSAMLSHNRRSNLKFAGYTDYLEHDKVWKAYTGDDVHTGISGAVVFSADTQSLVRVPAPGNSGVSDINYYGNIDRVIVPSRDDNEYECVLEDTAGGDYQSLDSIKKWLSEYKLNKSNGYPIVIGMDFTFTTSNYHRYFISTPLPLWSVADSAGAHLVKEERQAYGTDPVSIKYKSAPHAVVTLNYTKDHRQNVLPTLGRSGHYFNHIDTVFDNKYLPWDTSCVGIHQDVMTAETSFPSMHVGFGYSWLAELYRDDVDDTMRFGGKTEQALEANLWFPAGDAVSLISGYNAVTGDPIAKENDVEVEFTEGDTYYQRYDCLKTYPYTLEDQNSVTEIASFLCETRINIDGRYDRNRGQVDNLTMMPSNFNLLNPVYSQKDSFFSYRTLDYDRYTLDSFPNTITWSKEKQSGSDVDTWTNITMASTLDLDGDKGSITSLNTFNNEIFCFQRQGLSNILFNSRVQIPTSDSVPIEISNGMKVDGKRYISDTVGCQNKWSVCNTPSGLYFIDNLTRGIYQFNGQITPLSDRLGFKSWMSGNNSLDEWDPVRFNNFLACTDKNNGDVYFINKDTSLVYSETLGQFTSFMSYGYTPAMFNVGDGFYSFQNGKLWKQFDGDYNMFFGQFQPYSLTFVSNADEPYDKIFNNIEFRADRWSKDSLDNDTIVNKCAFDTFEVWDEYQKGITGLTDTPGRPSSLKRKFRVWRVDVPRANTDWNGMKANGRDRIRNTWAYMKLAMSTQNTDRAELHDVIVKYFI